MVIEMGDEAKVRNWALVNNKTNIVENLVIWDGETKVDFGDGLTAAEVPEGTFISTGFTYKDKEFIAPEVTKVEKTEEQIVQDNINIKQSLLDNASHRIVVWQTKLLIGRRLTSDETSQLNSWLDYIDTLESIDAETSSAVAWPTIPN